MYGVTYVANNDLSNAWVFKVNKSYISAVTGANRTDCTAIVTVLYTKTTD